MGLNRSASHSSSKGHNQDGTSGSVLPRALLPADFSRLIANASARLVKVANEDLDAEILQVLNDTLQPLGVDRGGLLEVWKDSPIVKINHGWYAEGLEHVSTEINLAVRYPWCYQHVVVQGKTWVMSRLTDLPPEAEVDLQSFLLLGSKSVLTIPLFIGQRVHHLFTVNALKAECSWPEEVISHLRLLGEIIVSALQRREAEQALRDIKDSLDLAAASANAGLWSLDLESGVFWATDKARQMFGFDADLDLTLERFLEAIHIDDRGLVVTAINEACHNGSALSVEYRAVLPDGQVRWMRSKGRMQTRGKSGRRWLMGVTLDETERKHMEREIARLRQQLEEENSFLRNEVAARDQERSFIKASGSMQAVLAKVKQVANTKSTVLILGETGTGKELIAEAIHRLSECRQRLMVKVNCAALPAALVESELFGREKGAFTGALSRQAGRFEVADGSTLFLDEIAEMPLDTQAKLLRVLQEGEFERLGSSRTVKVDVRIVAATNRDLAKEVELGRFRRDLYYRLNVFPIHLPPLRERQEDIPPLVWEFVNEFGQKMGKKISRIDAKDMQTLKVYDWPGNIRELRNVIEHAMIISKSELLDLEHFIRATPQVDSPSTLEDMERRHIQATLKATGGHVKGAGGAAERLGLNPSTLYSKLRKLGIKPVPS